MCCVAFLQDVGRFRIFGATLQQMPGWCSDLKYAAALGNSVWHLWRPKPSRWGQQPAWRARTHTHTRTHTLHVSSRIVVSGRGAAAHCGCADEGTEPAEQLWLCGMVAVVWSVVC